MAADYTMPPMQEARCQGADARDAGRVSRHVHPDRVRRRRRRAGGAEQATAPARRLSINIAWGLAVTMGCYVSAGVTGAHLNPAVTLALAVHRRFPWNKVLPYSVAQIAGAFVASAVVFVTYHEALDAFDGGVRQVLGAQGTAGIWATYPQPFLSTFPGGFIDQVVGTALLVGVIFGITDTRNSPAPAGLAPVVVGLLVVVIGATFGFNAGLRDQSGARLRPAAVHLRRRMGRRSVSRRQRWWWVPIVGPCVGGVLGGLVYDICVGKWLTPSL